MDEPANEVAADSDNADRVVLVPGSQLAETLRGDGNAGSVIGPRLVDSSQGMRNHSSMSNTPLDADEAAPRIHCSLGKRKRQSWKANTWLADLARTWDDWPADAAAMRILIDVAAKELPETRRNKTADPPLTDEKVLSVTNSVLHEYKKYAIQTTCEGWSC